MAEIVSKEGIDLTGLCESFNDPAPIIGLTKMVGQIVAIDQIAFQVKMVDGRVIMRRLIQNTDSEDYPGQTSEIRRERLIHDAVVAADRVLVGGADGSAEEINYLTAKVAECFATKVLFAMTSLLSRRDLEVAHREYMFICVVCGNPSMVKKKWPIASSPGSTVEGYTCTRPGCGGNMEERMGK
jgi:hypothetical protein